MAYSDAGWLLSTSSAMLCASSFGGPFSFGTESVSCCCVGNEGISRSLPLAIRPCGDRNLTNEQCDRYLCETAIISVILWSIKIDELAI